MYRFTRVAELEEEMEKELGVTEARKRFSSLIDGVKYRGDNYVIVKHGEPAAVIVPLSVYRQWQAERQELFDVIRRLQQENREADADEVMREVLAAQQALRQAGDRRGP